MRKDPILEELRAVREQISKECHHDLDEMAAYFQRKSREAGRTTVSLRPKRASKSPARTRPRRGRSA